MNSIPPAKPPIVVTQTKLKRSLNLPLLVLYGLGTTIGAGIYVLVGAAAGRAGIYAPWAFLFAAIAIAPTAASYGELAGRYPVSSGEAAFVEGGFRSKFISGFVGWLVIISGIVASAAVAIGCVGYIRSIVDLPWGVTVAAVVFIVGLIAAWGIMESVLVAAFFTIIEAGGLIVLIIAGFFSSQPSMAESVINLPPTSDIVIWLGIANAGLLAVFAFIGFEDMVNVAEETKSPKTTLPWAVFLTLLITTLLYTLVTIVAVRAVPVAELTGSSAPLALVFYRLTDISPFAISLIAIFATLNTILVQIIMVSRVIYGMSNQHTMPAFLGKVSAVTHTPLIATGVVTVVTLVLALGFELENLADLTALFVLGIWALANIALVLIKIRREAAPKNGFVVPIWVPLLGTVFSVGLILISIAQT